MAPNKKTAPPAPSAPRRGRKPKSEDAKNPDVLARKDMGERVYSLCFPSKAHEAKFHGYAGLARAMDMGSAKQATKISGWARGKSWPSGEALHALATKARISVDWLLTGIGEPLIEKRMQEKTLPEALAAHLDTAVSVFSKHAVAVDGDRAIETLLDMAREDAASFRRYTSALGARSYAASALNFLTSPTIEARARRVSAEGAARNALRYAKDALAETEASAAHLLEGAAGETTRFLRFRADVHGAPAPKPRGKRPRK